MITACGSRCLAAVDAPPYAAAVLGELAGPDVLVLVLLALVIDLPLLIVVALARGKSGRAPAPPLPPVAPQWAPDPVGRHEYRYWNGTRWTAQVADAGVVRSDQ
jgi:hypothetical protein